MKKFPASNSTYCRWKTELKGNWSEEEWWEFYPKFLRNIKPAKLRYLQYRIFTKKLTTNVVRAYWDEKISKKCTFCSGPDETILHLLYTCNKVLPLWLKLQKIIDYFWHIKVDFTAEMVILNNYTGAKAEVVNFLMIILKQYVYAKSVSRKNQIFLNIWKKLTNWYFIDKKSHAQKVDKLEQCLKKWSNLF